MGEEPTTRSPLAGACAARAAIAAVPEAVLVVDRDGRILDASLTSGAFGWTREIVDASVFDLVAEADRARLAIEIVRSLGDPGGAPAQVVRVTDGAGHGRAAEVVVTNRIDDPALAGLVISWREVTGSAIGERAMAAIDYLYQSLAAIPSDGATIFDSAGNRVYSSASLASLLGYSSTELASLGPAKLVHPDDVGLWRSAVREALSSAAASSRVECRLMHKTGVARWMETTVVNLLDDAGVRGVVAHVRDIDDRRRLEDELRRGASTDALTGLPNRSALMHEMRMMADAGVARVLCFLDLDGFKDVNDLLGHDIGDEVLVVVADALRDAAAAIPSIRAVARLGGDEFCALAEHVDEQASVELGERVRDLVVAAVAGPVLAGARVVASLAASVGVAWDELPGDARLMARADAAMYAAKRAGHNLVSVAAATATATLGPPGTPALP